MKAAELRNKKIISSDHYAGLEVGREKVVNFVKDWCTADDLDGVPLDDVYDAFYEHCRENNFPLINRMTLGRIFKTEIGVFRKRVRYKDKLVYVYKKFDF